MNAAVNRPTVGVVAIEAFSGVMAVESTGEEGGGE